MTIVWRIGAGETHSSPSRRAELGPRIGITCRVDLSLVYFVLVIHTFRSYGEVVRKARVVQLLADVYIELEMLPEWARDRVRESAGERARIRVWTEGERYSGP